MKYHNGNAIINIENDGTRTIEYENKLNLDWPLNIDIRVSTKCSFGLNTKTNKSFCDFCHESALTDGKECNYNDLKNKLKELPSGVELALGGNSITPGLIDFCHWAFEKGLIVNLTINQGHVIKYQHQLDFLINEKFIKGLGISYRKDLENIDIPERFKRYENTVLHVITGIDSIKDILEGYPSQFKKLLILGEKDFGFNKSKVDLKIRPHKEWYWWVGKVFERFEVVSFDNLAISQLNLKRFFTDENWNTFNQGENSFYINAVEKSFAPSSRSSKKSNWDDFTIQNYFKQLNKDL